MFQHVDAARHSFSMLPAKSTDSKTFKQPKLLDVQRLKVVRPWLQLSFFAGPGRNRVDAARDGDRDSDGEDEDEEDKINDKIMMMMMMTLMNVMAAVLYHLLLLLLLSTSWSSSSSYCSDRCVATTISLQLRLQLPLHLRSPRSWRHDDAEACYSCHCHPSDAELKPKIC